MMKQKRTLLFSGKLMVMFTACVLLTAEFDLARSPQPVEVHVDWGRKLSDLKTTPTLQVVVNPMLRRGTPVHDNAFRALSSLGVEYVRYVPWYPYPRLAVAELEPPTANRTSWDFALIDPMMDDFFTATRGQSTILNFSTIPVWMFRTDNSIPYPKDPNEVDTNYRGRGVLRDLSLHELTDYYARLMSWYTQGGFTDELGHRHESGHHYKIAYWEVLNEMEHHPSPQQYAQQYDAIVKTIRKISPETKFVGLALGSADDVEMFEYFLDHSHHHAGIPLDFISYHFYAHPTIDQTLDDWQYTFFDQADGLLSAARYVEAIRKRLSPETKTDLDEVGTMLPTDNTPDDAKDAIPAAYWNLSGALYAYVFLEAARLGIDVVGESQLVGYPSQYPSVSMVDWKTGMPNARFRVLQLLHEKLLLGDQLVETEVEDDSIAAQAFVASQEKKLLLINKRNHTISVRLPGELSAGTAVEVDGTTGAQPPAVVSVSRKQLQLQPFAVAVVYATR